MKTQFDAKAAAQRSLELASKDTNPVEANNESDDVLRKRINNRTADWESIFAEKHARDFPPQNRVFSDLNVSNPVAGVVNVIRRLQVAEFRGSGAPDQIVPPVFEQLLAGLRAELIAVATRVEASSPDDAERLRRLCAIERPVVMTLEELEYEAGRSEVNVASSAELPRLLESPTTRARMLGRRDAARDLGRKKL